jgi:hypothetical protein
MHARIKFYAYSDIKVNTETVSHKKKEDYQRFTLRAVDWGLRTPNTSNIFTRLQSSFLFLSNIVYSKGGHLSYSASVGKIIYAKAL